MRAVVTGAAGFIGSHLCEALVDADYEVVAVDCLTPYYEVELKEQNLALVEKRGCEVRQLDLRSCDLDALVADADIVFHQAAQPGVRLSWSEGFDEYVSCNVISTQRVLEALRERPNVRLVYASSSSVYGNASSYPTAETDLPTPFSPYGVTKLAAEHLCHLYAENWGVDTVSLRYFTVYGPRQRPDMSIHRLCEAALRGTRFTRFGDGSQIREFTHVSDIVRGNLLAAVADIVPGSVFNLSGGGAISLSRLIELVGELAGSPILVEEQPETAGDARRNGGSIRAASASLGWRPEVDLRSGIADQLRWHTSRAAAV